MTSELYQNFIETMLAPGNAGNGHGGATIDLLDSTTSPVTITLISSSYTFDESHPYHDSLTDAAIVFQSETALSSLAFNDGATSGVMWTAANLNAAGAGSMTGVGDGVDAVDAIVVWVNTAGAETTDPLVAYIDTGTGFGVIPNSSTVDIVWNAAGIINFNYS